MSDNLTSRITHMDIDDLLDNVPKVNKKDLEKTKLAGVRGRRKIPVDVCLSVFLEWNRGRRLTWPNRKSAGLLPEQIAERYGISAMSVSNIGHRKLHWERIRPQVAEMVATGQAPYLLEPMYKK